MEQMKLLNYGIKHFNNKVNNFLIVSEHKKRRLMSLIDISFIKPISIVLSITYRCNLSCRHCDIWKSDIKELSTNEIKKGILMLKRWLGPYQLIITGGEPLLRKDLIKIIRFCTEHHITTNLCTNGTLIDKNLANKILDSGLRSISISLPTLNSNAYDSIKNRKGTFAKVYNGIQYLNVKNRKLEIIIATIVMKYNIDSLLEITKWIKKNNLNGLDLQPLLNNLGSDYKPDWYINDDLWPDDYRNVTMILGTLIRRNKKDLIVKNSLKHLRLMQSYYQNPNKYIHYRCTTDINNLHISSSGYLYLCYELPSIGSITKDNPQNIWVSKLAQEQRKQIRRCTRNCKLLNCNFD